MMRRYRGDHKRPTAAEINRWNQQANNQQLGLPRHPGFPTARAYDPSSRVVFVENTSGSDRAQFETMSVDGLKWDLATDGSNDVIFAATTADPDECAVVLIEPIADGAIGRAVIDGVALALVGGGSGSYATADATNHRLTPDAAGTIKLLTAPHTTTTRLLPVVLNTGRPETPLQEGSWPCKIDTAPADESPPNGSRRRIYAYSQGAVHSAMETAVNTAWTVAFDASGPESEWTINEDGLYEVWMRLFLDWPSFAPAEYVKYSVELDCGATVSSDVSRPPHSASEHFKYTGMIGSNANTDFFARWHFEKETTLIFRPAIKVTGYDDSLTAVRADKAGIQFGLRKIGDRLNCTNSSFGTQSIPTGTVGVAYSWTPSVSGTPPSGAFSARNLPGWASIDADTGEVSGTPGASGDYDFTVFLTTCGITAAYDATITVS